MKEQVYRCCWRNAVCASLVLAAGMLMASAARAEAAGKGQSALAMKNIPIKHIIIIVQENRSFDSYFGTYPGADGIPMQNGVPTVCNPDPKTGECVKPYPDHNDVNCGGPHSQEDSLGAVASGKMNGFIREVQLGGFGFNPHAYAGPLRNCHDAQDGKESDKVMGYHDGGDLPNYWAYAKHFVLQDHMFESLHSWSFPSHLFLVSAWSAKCGQSHNPMSCVSALMPNNRTLKNPTPFAWTDITWLLHKGHVSWVYYLDHGAAQGQGRPPRSPKKAARWKGIPGVPSIWNVLPGFADVHENNQLANVKDLSRYFSAA